MKNSYFFNNYNLIHNYTFSNLVNNIKGDKMKIRLGFLGNPHTLLEGFHTMNYTRYKKLGNKAEKELDKLILANLDTLNKIIEYNKKNNIFFYRIIDNLLPLATIENINYDYTKFKDKFKKIGDKIKKYNMRVDIHPDHFCILSSNRKEVIENSIRILKIEKFIFDMLDIKAKVIIHIGSKNPSKEEALNRFKTNFFNLEKDIKEMIILENDDVSYTASETLSICQELNIPMVLDYHHFNCNHEKNEKIEKLLPKIIKTWKSQNPKMHFSSPKSQKEKRTHHFYIDYNSFLKFINLLKNENIDIDIMLESKGKDEALFKLLRQLKYYNMFKFIKNDIILD